MPDTSPPRSAEIIAFPQRPATSPTFSAPETVHIDDLSNAETPTQRLQRALATLAAAQQEQKEALARWREAIGGLQSSMHGLGVSLRTTQDRLERISPNHTP